MKSVMIYSSGGKLINQENPFPVENVSNRQLQGLADERPDPGEVEIGTVYWAVDTGDVSVSTGTVWRSLGVV